MRRGMFAGKSNVNVRKLIIAGFLVSICVINTSCSGLAGVPDDIPMLTGGYVEKVIELQSPEGIQQTISDIQKYNDDLYITLLQSQETDSGEYQLSTVIRQMNIEGDTVSELTFEDRITPSGIADGNFVFLDMSGKINLVDIYTGEVTDSFKISNQIYAASVCSQGILLYEPYSVSLVNVDGSNLRTVTNSEWFLYADTPFYEDDDELYIISSQDAYNNYYKVDFDSLTCEEVGSSALFNASLMDCYGQYILNQYGEYRIDFENRCLEQIVDWNNCNIQPERKSLYMQTRYEVLDETQFARIYTYGDNTSEIILLTYDENIEYPEAQVITVGGMGVSQDLSMRWCQYLYNKQNSDYRIQLIDYADGSVITSYEDIINRNAELISYFNDGNAPDIFYGNTFDYNYFGRVGMVMDLNELAVDYNLDLSAVTPNLIEAMAGPDGSLYQLFSSYSIRGYWGIVDNFPSDNVSIYQLHQLNNDTALMPLMYASELAYQAVGYNYMNLYENGELTPENMHAIIQYGIDYGIEPNAFTDYGGMMELAQDEYLMTDVVISDFYSFLRGYVYCARVNKDIQFLGYPSLSGSVHIAQPEGLVAVSGSTQYPEQCADFLSVMLGEEVQKILCVNQCNPVNDNVLNEFLEYVINPASVPAGDILSSRKDYEIIPGADIPGDSREAYLTAINAIDSVAIYDQAIYSIIQQEVDSYYLNEKEPMAIAQTLCSRLEIYISENYG